MQFVVEFAIFGLCAAFVMWVFDWVIADAVAKGIAKSGLQLDVQDRIEEGVTDALEAYFGKRSFKDLED